MANDETVQKILKLAEDLRTKRGDLMQAYKPNCTEGQVRAAFYDKFGVEPERCVRVGPIWLAGPVPKRERPSE